MKRLHALILSLVLFALTPLQLGQFASAVGNNGGASPYAVQLPDIDGGYPHVVHFEMSADQVVEYLVSNEIYSNKYVSSAKLPNGHISTHITGTLTHSLTGTGGAPRIYVGFCTLSSSGNPIPHGCTYYQSSTASVHETYYSSFFGNINTKYYGYIRNNRYSSGNNSYYNGTISGTLTFYSFYTES